jgi:hypothetical protein
MSENVVMNKPVEDDELPLKEVIFRLKIWFKYILSKWYIVLLAVVIGCVGGWLYSRQQKNTYRAELSFVVEGEGSSGAGAYAGIASQFGLDIGGGASGAFSGENLLELMKSRSLVEKALLSPVVVDGKTQSLAEYYIGFNRFRESWKNDKVLSLLSFEPQADRGKFTLKQDSVLGSFYKIIIGSNLLIERKDPKSGIMKIKVKSENELFSKLFSESLVNVVSDFYVDTKTKRSAENLAILQQQTDSVRRVLNYAISGVASSVDANPNLNPALQILRAPSQRRNVDVQANQAILTELVKNLEMAKISVRKETPLIQIIDSPILPLDIETADKKQAIMIGGFLCGFFALLFVVLQKVMKTLNT